MRDKEERMRKENKRMIIAAAILFAAFALLFVLPLKAEETEAKSEDESLKGNITMAYLSPKDSTPQVIPAPSKPKVVNDASKVLGKRIKAQKVGDSLFTSSLVAFAVLNAADYITTVKALKCDGLCEGNPIMKPIVKNNYVFAAVKIGMTVINYKLMKSLYKKDKKMAWVLSTAFNFAFSYVVANNLKMIQKVQDSQQ